MIQKIIAWASVNLVSILGIVQAVIKFVKEVLTACVNILFPVIPSASFQGVVKAVRGFVEIADGWVEKAKEFLLKVLPK